MRLPPERRPRPPPRPRLAATAPLSRADRTEGTIVAAAHKFDVAGTEPPELKSMGGSSEGGTGVLALAGGGVGAALTRRSSMPSALAGGPPPRTDDEPW
ncbi:hypothetical protein MRX96_019551 [Rhipicephalus microplus]